MPGTKIDVLTEFILKWHVPQLSMWIDIGHYKTREKAWDAEKWFRCKMQNTWVGEIELATVKVTEEETT